MNLLINKMSQDVLTSVVPYLRQVESQFVQDVGFTIPLNGIMSGIKSRYRNVDAFSQKVASDAVRGEAENNIQKFNKGIERQTGISLQRIVAQESLTDVIQAQIRVNVDLIQSIPDEYYKKLSEIIYSGVNEGDKVGSLVREIQKLTKVTKNRAKLIARDQTQKTNALITHQRQAALGVEEYIWQTSGDERVRKSHLDNNGKKFRWDKPDPVTGHPGHDINCRCVARAVIEL